MDTFTYFGVTFYEHPTLGDEAPLFVKKNGKLCQTDLWDAPDSADEAQDAYEAA